MDEYTQVLLYTLIFYKIVLIGIGILASSRNKSSTDFYLGGRTLGPVVAAVSASASSSSAWTLLGVSGYAYLYGVSAVWIFPACVGGFLVNWYVVAPRLQRLGRETEAVTLTEVFAGKEGSPYRRAIATSASLIILFSLFLYIAAQIQASGKLFETNFELDFTQSVLIGSAIIALYTMLGGFWAVSLTDTLQGFIMAIASIVLPIKVFLAVELGSGFFEGVSQVPVEGYSSFIRNMPLGAGIGFVIGLLGIGLGYPGQPHVVNRFMALRDEKALCSAQKIAIGWGVCVYAGMIVLGLGGRILFSVEDPETIMFIATKELFSPVVGGIIIAGVLSAIMSTADSQLLVAASAITYDMNLGKPAKSVSPEKTVWQARLVVLLLSLGAVGAALYGSREIFSRVLSAWNAMGAAFGPILLIRLLIGPIKPRFLLIAMISGFVLSVAANNIPAIDKTAWETIGPFFIALAIAYTGCERKQEEVN